MQISVDGYWIAGKHIPGYNWADTEPHQSPQNYNIQPLITAQHVGALRGASSKHFDRKNDTTRITFEVSREHSTLGEAEKFLHYHRVQAPRRGLVRIFSQSSFGGASTITFLRNALVQITNIRHMGRTNFTAYEITGGAIETEDPTYS